MSEATKEAPKVEVPVVEKYPDGSPIVKGAAGTQFWPTEAEAVKIANGRSKGARLAFKVTDKAGNVRFATATHHHYLEEYLCCTELGFNVEEIGKPAKAKAPVTADTMAAAIAALPTEAERENLKKQLAELLGLKLPPAPAKK